MNSYSLYKKNFFKSTLFLLVFFLSVAIMVHLVWSSKEEIFAIRTQINFLWLLLTFPLYFIASIFSGFVWGRMMNSLGCTISLRQQIVIYIATIFAGRIPGGIWNVLGRIAWYDRLGVSKRITTIVSGMQWFLILWSGAIVSLLILPWYIAVSIQNYLIIIITNLLLALLFHPRVIGAIIKKVIKDYPKEKIHFKSIFSWLMAYIIIWLIGGTILHFAILSVYNGIIAWPISVAAWSVGYTTGTLVTVLPSGFGVTEVITSFLLMSYLPSSTSLVIALLTRVLLTFYDFLLSGVFFLYRKRLFSINSED